MRGFSDDRRRWLQRAAACGAAVALGLMGGLGGCAAAQRAEVEYGYLAIEANRYHEAFDAAGEVARTYGLVPALRDRRAGIVETEPAIAGSLLEPWDRATKSIEQAASSTFSFQRRRARFEFQPAGFDPETAEADRDLTELEAAGHEFELRVWVYNERAHVPGIRRSAWSRRLTTHAEVIDTDSGRRRPPVWTVVARDRALEEHLLAQVGRALDR